MVIPTTARTVSSPALDGAESSVPRLISPFAGGVASAPLGGRGIASRTVLRILAGQMPCPAIPTAIHPQLPAAFDKATVSRPLGGRLVVIHDLAACRTALGNEEMHAMRPYGRSLPAAK